MEFRVKFHLLNTQAQNTIERDSQLSHCHEIFAFSLTQALSSIALSQSDSCQGQR